MFSNVLHTIDGIEIYPIFSLLLFFVFFLVVTFIVIKADKSYLSKMENLPLDPDENSINNDFEINQRV